MDTSEEYEMDFEEEEEEEVGVVGGEGEGEGAKGGGGEVGEGVDGEGRGGGGGGGGEAGVGDVEGGTGGRYATLGKAGVEFRRISKEEVRLGDRLGGGGFALVHSGEFEGEEVAVKVLFDPRASMQLIREFQDEVHVMAALQGCEHVVRLLGASTTPPKLCCVMERCEGSVWEKLYKKKRKKKKGGDKKAGGGGCGIGERVGWVVEACEGVAEMHSRSPPLVHRDLKPHNLLFSRRGKVVLCDFGLCLSTNPTAGTPHYMAPELIQAKRFGPPVDVWALGCLLLEVCAKEPPHAGRTIPDIIQLARSNTPPPIPAAVPADLRPLIAQTLHPEPDKRPSAPEMLARLREWKPKKSKIDDIKTDALDSLLK